MAIAKEAGYEVSKADWIRYQAKQTLELKAEELEAVAGGGHHNIEAAILAELLNMGN